MLRTLIAGTVALAIGLAILVTTVIDDVAPPGATDIITVWDSNASSSGSFQRLVERTAEHHHMTVMKELRHESGSGVVRREYVTNAGATRSFESVRRDLTGFDPSLSTSFHPFSDLPDNRINGTYFTDAGDASARAFAASLAEHGIALTVNTLSPFFISLWVVSEIPAIPLSGCLVIAVVLGTTAWQSGRRRRVAIAASHGRSAVRSAWSDAAGLAARTTVWGLVGITAVATALVVVNGGTRITTFVFLAVASLTVAVSTMAATTLVAAALPRSSMLASINGARPWRTVLVIALIGNLGALTLGSVPPRRPGPTSPWPAPTERNVGCGVDHSVTCGWGSSPRSPSSTPQSTGSGVCSSAWTPQAPRSSSTTRCNRTSHSTPRTTATCSS